MVLWQLCKNCGEGKWKVAPAGNGSGETDGWDGEIEREDEPGNEGIEGGTRIRSGHKDKIRAEGEEPAGISSKLLPIPLKQEITEALDIEKRKDMVVIRGFQESEDMDEKVGMIMKELGFSKQYTVMGRIGGLRKRGAEESDIADIGKNRLVSLKMESVAVKWRVVSESRKLSNSEKFKDIFISPDLTRKQAEEDRKLRLKLKEIRVKGEVLDGVKISKGRIVGRVDGHVIYDPSAWLVGGFPKESI